jgi:hypothetical protein
VHLEEIATVTPSSPRELQNATFESHLTNIILHLDQDTIDATDESLLIFLEGAVVEAYDAVNRYNQEDNQCDPFGRQIDSVNASVILDPEDLTFAYVVDRNEKGNEDDATNTTLIVLLEVLLTCIVGCGDGHGHVFEVAKNTTTSMDLQENYDLQAQLPANWLCPVHDNTTSLGGPTHDQFQEQLAMILRNEFQIEDDGIPLVFHVDEALTMACSTTLSAETIQSSITQVVLVDFLVNCSLVDADVALLADQFVQIYNELSRENYCDPYFRQISSANVLRRGETRLESDGSVLTIEIELVGSCIGCDPNIDGFYDVPTNTSLPNNAVSINEAIDMEVTSIDVNSTTYINSTSMNNTDDTINSTVVNDNTTRHRRSLERTTRPIYLPRQDGVCYCPTRAVAARAPS